MIHKNTTPGSTVWYVHKIGDFINRIHSFENRGDALDWLIRKSKIIKRAKEDRWDCPGYFWVEFVNKYSDMQGICASPSVLFLSCGSALSHASGEIKSARSYEEKELGKIYASEWLISEARAKEAKA